MTGYQSAWTRKRKPALDQPHPLVIAYAHQFTRMKLQKHIGLHSRLEVHEFKATSLRNLVIEPSR